MPLPKFLERLARRPALTTFKLADSLLDGGDRLDPVEPVQKSLIASGVLDYELGAAVDGEHQRGSLPLEPARVALYVALKLGDGTDFSEVNHDGRLSACFKQTIL
jgi:hypothetical protein